MTDVSSDSNFSPESSSGNAEESSQPTEEYIPTKKQHNIKEQLFSPTPPPDKIYPETIEGTPSFDENELRSSGDTKTLIGRALGPYRLEEKIGQGGMGAVFKAHDTALDRIVAVKVLASGPIGGGKSAERFMREARSMAKLKHPNLLHVYNVGEQEGMFYIAMELLDGESLAQTLRKKKTMSPDETVNVAADVLSALQYVHEKGIIHRDIKAGNIHLCSDRAVLMDFGLAKEEESSGLTSTGIVLGTPDYMSPEQAEGLEVGAGSDIYSFGIVLFEMLTGSVPFRGRSALSIIRQHAEAQPPSMAERNPDIPRNLEAIVLRCMEKRPEDRFRSCAAMALAIHRIYPRNKLDELVKNFRGVPALIQPASQLSRKEELDQQATAPTMVLDAAELGSASPEESSEKSLPPWAWALVGFLGMLVIAIGMFLYMRGDRGRGKKGNEKSWQTKSKTTDDEIELIRIHMKTRSVTFRVGEEGEEQTLTIREFRRKYGNEFNLMPGRRRR